MSATSDKKPPKVRWSFEKVIGNRQYRARRTREETIVRVEMIGTDRWTEWGYPKQLPPFVAVDQAHLEIKDEALKP